MENIFLKILNISITASWLVLAVLLMRLVLKKAPKWLSVVMWALVGIRLVLPFSFESIFSLIPSAETVPPEILYEQAPQIHTGFDALNSAVNPVISESFAPAPGASVNPLQVITFLAGWLWIIGMAGMVIYTLISCLRIRNKLREAVPLGENIYLCDRIETPFIFGIFRPKIYLPSAMAGADIPFVLAHEKAHLKRRDHLWKPLGFLLLTVYWFNPLLWLAYILLCRDIEAACDEKVLTDMGDEVKKPYSQALVNCSVPRKMIAACPLAFGEVNVKSRIKKVLSYKKPAFWLLIAAVVVCIVLSVCFLTNPRTVNEQMQVFLDCQIAEHFQTEKSQGNACCLDYEILGTKKRGKTTTVYMWVLYEEYSYQQGQLQQETGSHIPTVITASKEDGNYRLVEYFEPRDGAYNPGDIKAKFPWYLWPKAMDSQRYIKRQKQACQELAEQYFKENPPATEETLQPLTALREKYPEYFDLPTNNGLEVYVWQMSPESYYWGLLPGRAVDYDEATLLDLKGASLEEICAIVASYNLDSNQITVHPFQMPYSSYYYVIDEAYQTSVEQLFWGQYSSVLYSESIVEYLKTFLGTPIDTAVFDIDNDGKDETCTITFGPTSGLFTFVVAVYEDDQLEYHNIFNSPWGYLSFIEKEDGIVGVCRDGRGQNQGCDIYDIVVIDGHIQLTLGSEVLPYWGPQGVDDSAVLKDQPADKQQAIAKCERVELSYHGNHWNRLNVTDPQVCAYLAAQVSQAQAAGKQDGSSKGYYGAPYVISLYLEGQEAPHMFALWDENTYSDPAHKDSEGYEYFYKADLSELFDYLQTNYPDEFWYGNYDDVTVSFAGGSSDLLPDIWEECLNRDKIAISSVRHLPILKFDTLAELESFKARYPGAIDVTWDEVPSFNTVTAQYDEAFFDRYTLVLVYVPCANCTHRFDVFNVFYGRNALMVRVYETTDAEIVADAEAHWFITVAIPDSVADNTITFDAVLGDH